MTKKTQKTKKTKKTQKTEKTQKTFFGLLKKYFGSKKVRFSSVF